ncbi:hypothetical protein STEG23_027892, partial [Scotinomys teguina]
MATCRRLQIDPYLSPCTKLKSKWIKDLNINPVTLNLIEEKVGSTLERIGTGDHFLNITPTAQTLSATINQWDYMKLRSFCKAKDTVTKTKHQPTEWEKIFTNPTSDRGLISRIYKELKKHDIKTPNSPIEKWAIELNREFTAEEYRMAERHLRKCSTSLLIREMQIKTTLRYHLTPVRMAKIKTLGTVHVGEDVEQEEHFSTVGGNADWYNHYGKQSPGPLASSRAFHFVLQKDFLPVSKHFFILSYINRALAKVCAFICKMVPFVQCTAIVTEILTMTCIAVERHQGLVHPFKMKRQYTNQRAFTMLGVVWLVAIIIGSPMWHVQRLE